MAALHDRVVAVTSLRDFFRESMNSAIDNQKVEIDPHTSHYVVNLLTLFARSEEFYNESDEHCGVRPLALMMADAAAAESRDRRTTSLQRIGDVALFTAGFFADSLAHRAVDIDYYVSMGGCAYGSLSDEIKGTTRGMALVNVFRTYEIWRKTGSRRAAAILELHGVVPISGAAKTH